MLKPNHNLDHILLYRIRQPGGNEIYQVLISPRGKPRVHQDGNNDMN